MQITSTNFDNLDPLPSQFSRDGDNINPALTFSEIPEAAETLALIVEDPDAPNGVFTHWILYNMLPGTLQITEGELPLSGEQGLNDWGEQAYGGPQPPSGTHRYFFRLYALDTTIDTPEPLNREAFYTAIQDHTIDHAEIISTFSAE